MVSECAVHLHMVSRCVGSASSSGYWVSASSAIWPHIARMPKATETLHTVQMWTGQVVEEEGLERSMNFGFYHLNRLPHIAHTGLTYPRHGLSCFDLSSPLKWTQISKCTYIYMASLFWIALYANNRPELLRRVLQFDSNEISSWLYIGQAFKLIFLGLSPKQGMGQGS